MKRPLFTPEELAELAAFDAEVESQPGYDPEEVKAQRRRDTEMRWDGLDNKERAAAEKRRAYREANRDSIAEKKRAYREANRDSIAEQKRAYWKDNRDTIAEQQRAYYEANRDKIAERKRAYREANRDTIAEQQRNKYHETTSDQNAETSPLRHWRRINRLSQKAAGLLFGVSQQQISHYERGFTPIPDNVMEAIGYAQ